MDHDQRFKTLLRAHFADFIELFFAEWAERMDFSAVEWLDKEVFPDPPEGSRHVLDLVARLSMSIPSENDEETTVSPSMILIHVEIESPDRTTSIKPRMPYYYHHLREEHQLPVLPIVLYLKVGLDGIGIDSHIERLWTLEVNHFQYLYVGLPALDAIQYLEGENWLGVALSALMQVPTERVVWLGAEALRRLAGAPLSEQKRFLLADCVQAYLPINEQQKQELDQVLQTEAYRETQHMNKTVYDEGLEKGIEQGRLRLIEESLTKRLGPIPEQIRERLKRMSMEELIQLNLKIGTATSFADLDLEDSQ